MFERVGAYKMSFNLRGEEEEKDKRELAEWEMGIFLPLPTITCSLPINGVGFCIMEISGVKWCVAPKSMNQEGSLTGEVVSKELGTREDVGSGESKVKVVLKFFGDGGW